MSSMNMRAKGGVSIVFLQAHQCALFVMWSTNVTMQSWPFPEVGRSVMKSMPILCQWPFAIGSCCRRPMGFPLHWLVWWPKSQPATYRWVSRHICFQKYRPFIRKYIRSAPKFPPVGVLWASWRICCCIVLGIHNHPLSSAFPSSSFSFALAVLFTYVFSKSPLNHSMPFSSKKNRCAATHNLRSLVDAVDGRGRGLRLTEQCAVGPNHSASIMPALMSSTHSPPTVISREIELHRSCRKSRRRHTASIT